MNIKLIPLYESMLRAAGLSTTKDGFVRLEYKGESMPVTKDGQQMVLPIREQLISPHIRDRIVFHPLAENPLENESKVTAFYRHLLVSRLNSVISTLCIDLLELAASDARHPSLTSDQQEFLSLVPDVNERTVKDFMSLIAKMPATQVQRSITAIFLKKSAVVNKKSFKRVASVNFPLYTELKKWAKEDAAIKADREAGHKTTKKPKSEGGKSGYEIFDVSLRVKDREPLMNLLQYLIPQIDEPEAYNYGSNSMVAPGVDALMHAFMEIAGPINAVIDLFTGAIDDIEKLRFDSEWVEGFDNLEVLWPQIRDIPSQSVPDVPVAATAAPVAAAPAVAAPVHAAPPAVAAPLPWQQQTPAPVSQPQQGHWVNGVFTPIVQQAPAWQPGQGLPQAPQPPASTAHGSSFASIMQANPALAGAIPGGPQPYGSPYGMPQQPAYGSPVPQGNLPWQSGRRY